MSDDTSSNVRFHRVSEFHCVNNTLHVIVESANGYQIKSSDWIGLFVVGWSSVDQFVLKQNVAFPESTLFSADSLPRDFGHFYQLCYFDSTNNLHGISTTFSFASEDNSYMTDSSGDGVIVDINDCDNDDVVLVKTSRSQLELALAKAIQEKLQLQKMLTEQTDTSRQLTESYDTLKTKFETSQSELVAEREKTSALSEEKSKACSRVQALEAEAKINQSVIEELRLSISKRSNDETAAKLSTDNERLLKRVQELEQQIASQLNDCERLKEQIVVHDEIRRNLYSENQELTGRVRELGNQVVHHQKTNDTLEESLKNAEERLSVNEDLKRMLQQEVDSLMAVQRSLAARLEDAKNECHSLKLKVSKLEKDLEGKQRSQAAIEERSAELERAQADAVLKFLSQKEQTEEAERKVSELKLRLEKAADEYRTLYRQVHKKEAVNSPNVERASARPSSATEETGANNNNISSSLSAPTKCPLCDAIISLSEIQQHFQAHDEQQTSDSSTSKCPVCSNFFPVADIQSHVESHFVE